MNLVFDAWRELSLTENYLKQMHSVLLKFSRKDGAHRGEYKKLSNNVVAFDGDGREIGVVFETASPFETALETGKLINWTNHAVEDKTLRPLLTIAVFVVCFLAIHPFQGFSSEILALLREHERLSIAEIEILTKANRNTLKVRLRELVRDNFIEQCGKARSTWYSLKA
jgi:Fic family protein